MFLLYMRNFDKFRTQAHSWPEPRKMAKEYYLSTFYSSLSFKRPLSLMLLCKTSWSGRKNYRIISSMSLRMLPLKYWFIQRFSYYWYIKNNIKISYLSTHWTSCFTNWSCLKSNFFSCFTFYDISYSSGFFP